MKEIIEVTIKASGKSGKTTALNLIEQCLKSNGYDVLYDRDEHVITAKEDVVER